MIILYVFIRASSSPGTTGVLCSTGARAACSATCTAAACIGTTRGAACTGAATGTGTARTARTRATGAATPAGAAASWLSRQRRLAVFTYNKIGRSVMIGRDLIAVLHSRQFLYR